MYRTRLSITRWIIIMTQKRNQREERERKEKVIKGKIKEGHQRGRENTNNKVIENELKVSVIKRHLLTLTPPHPTKITHGPCTPYWVS